MHWRHDRHPVECCSQFLDKGEHLSAPSGASATTYPTARDEVDPVTVSVAEAAKLAKCSDDTIRRRLRAGKLRGAYQDGLGDGAPWRIPVTALIEEGLCDPSVLDQLDERLNPNVARLANQLVDLKAELTSERTKREAAEKLYATALAEVEYLRKTLDRALTLSLGANGNGVSNGRSTSFAHDSR